jgi:hypothetical protein
MEVDLVVALETWPIESKITSRIGIRSDIVDGFGEVEGATLILATTLIEAITHSDRIVKWHNNQEWMRANLMVEIGMEGGTSILIQPESSIVLTTITLSLVVTTEDLGVDGSLRK